MKIDYRALVLLSIGHMIVDFNAGALPAMLPFLKESLGLSYAMVGTIVLVSNIMSSVIQPAFGYLTDRKSLLWFLPLGSFCAALGMAMVGWASSYPQVLIIVTVSGLGVAIYHPEGWRVANFFAGEKKATGMSIFAVGGNLGIAVGPLMAAFFITSLGLKGSSLFVIPGAVIAGIFLFSRFWRIDTTAIKKKTSSVPVMEALRKALHPLSLLLGMIMLRSWTHIGMLTFIPFFYINHMDGDPILAGNLLFAFLAAGTVGTFLGGPLADRFGHKRILLFSLGFSCPLFVLFLLSSGFWAFFWLTAAGLVLIFSFSVSMVMGQSFLPHNVGLASGLILGLSFGMGGVGAAVLGLFADYWGVPATLWMISFIPLAGFLLAAFIPYPARPTTARKERL
ncbi:MAG: MFS transporter [Deltaproteobacteria bacterium]|nr:MFS transporter [Deltaproteobacteria bacterium]